MTSSNDRERHAARGPDIAGPGAATTGRETGIMPGGAARLPPEPLWNNAITIAGILMAVMGVLGLLTFGLFEFVAPTGNPYVDIVGYLVVPGVLVLGLLVMPAGVLVKRWRLQRRDPERKIILGFPRINLHDPAQWRAAKVVIISTFFLLPVVGVASYQGYHYTDSVGFCSKVCHTVMEPEATAYRRSDHARVTCAECHIGAGASWFVKSKLSGTRQVIAVSRNSYSRPIPPAIHELRPARETCEQCHWPEKFYGAQLAELVHFASDAPNTRRDIRMLLKTGGGSRSGGRVEGIHMHIAMSGRIEFVATDDGLQEIPWVKLTDFDGREVIYRSDGRPHSDPRPEGRMRHMDCMDCHNRPSHRFLSPSDAVDRALRDGAIDSSLPFIKRESVAALLQPYPDTATAAAEIDTALTGFYAAAHPDVFATHQASIRQAVETVIAIYRAGFFSYMKVDWRTYPENIGHMISPGCFRCHDGRHVNSEGRPISHACDGCHTFLNSARGGTEAPVLHEGEFVHSLPLEGRHAELRCDRCHTGGTAPKTTCAGCHSVQTDFRTGKLAGLDLPDLPAEPMADGVECTDCHDAAKPVSLEAISQMCVDCHDEEYAGTLSSWREEIDRLLPGAEAKAGPEARSILDALRRAGPLHNVEASRIIIQRVTGQDATD